MSDVFDAKKRSEVMSRIKGTGNKSTELALVQLMRAARITGWRRHVEIKLRYQGRHAHKSAAITQFMVKPDFIFRAVRLAVFVDGCFWHQCSLHSSLPANNRAFWVAKLRRNVSRDRRSTRLLRLSGWSVLRLWEHDLADCLGTIRRLRRCLTTARRRQSQLAQSGQYLELAKDAFQPSLRSNHV